MGQAVSGDPDFAIGQGDPVERISELLRQRPALIILDNFESVLGRNPLIPPEELQAILDAVWTWATSKPQPPNTPHSSFIVHHSSFLITTRDTTFNDPRFSPSQQCRHLALAGLAPYDAPELAAAVLADHGLDRADIPRQDLLDLMERLGGHPLSLYLVLPHLRRHTPAELSARFEELLPGFTTGKAKERNESLAVSLDFSLRRLGDDTRDALPALAVFQGGAMEYDLLAITQMDPDLWQTARAEMEQAALVTVETLPGITAPFLRFHPTLLPYLATQLSSDRRAELEARYWQEYYGTASSLYQLDTQHPHQARAIALRELPNLQHAFALCLAMAQESTSPPLGGTEGGPSDDPAYTAINFADSIAKFLNNFGRWRERDALLKSIEQLAINSEQGITQAEVLHLSRQGETLLEQGRVAQAERVFRDLLAKIEAGTAYDATYHQGTTLMCLGRCLAAQGQSTRAIEWHRRALEAFEQLSESNEAAKRQTGYVHADLADNLAATGQFDKAQKHYEISLKLARETDNHRSAGVALGQLGNLALARGDLAESQKRHTEALDTFRALGEPQVEAVAWHQLGRVAQEAKAWDEAERCYRESLKLEEQMNNPKGVAETCNQLALVAKGAGRLDDAERWYLRAIKLGEQLGDRTGLAKRLSNLANLYLNQGRLDEADKYARRAVEIDEAIGDPSVEIWKDYSILAQIAGARGRAGEAAEWRRKEQESYAAYAGAGHQMRQYQPLIQAIVAACEGNEEAMQQLESILQGMENRYEINRRFAQATRRILAGERDVEVLMANLNSQTAFVIRGVLAQLAGEAPVQQDPSPGPSPPRGGESAAQTAEVSADEHRPTSAVSDGAANEALAQLRAQWGPVIGAVVAACQGNAQAAEQVGLFMEQLAQQEQWRNLAAVLKRLLAGERDPAALLPGLDQVDTFVIVEILRGLGADPTSPPLAGEGPGEGSMTLDDLLNLVATAIRPDAPAGLGEQLFGATQAMAADANAPAEIRALGRVLNHILSGDREPDLSALPPEVAEKVRSLLLAQ